MIDSQTYDVNLTRTFNVPVAEAWKAWTDSKIVKAWWGPTGFSCPVAEMDVREGGRSLVCMEAPAEYGGGRIYSTWTYTHVEHLKQFDYIFNFSDEHGNKITPAEAGVPGGIPEDGHHTLTFESVDDNTTKVTIVERGYTDQETQLNSAAGMNQCFDKMAKSLEG